MVEHLHAEGEEPAVTLDAFLDQSNATAVRLEPDDDARALIPHLDRLALSSKPWIRELRMVTLRLFST